MKQSKFYLWRVSLFEVTLITLLTIIAFTTRVSNLSSHSLWNDELWTVYFSSTRHLKSVWDMLQIISTKLAENPPLYPLIMRGWIHFFGDGTISIRLPSVIFGSLSIPLLYVCLKQIVNKRISIFAAILLLFSPIHIYFSREARTYALFFLLSLLSMYFYFLLNKNFKKRYAVGYVVTTSLMLFSHYYALFLVLGQFILFLTVNKKKKNWILLFLCVALLFAPWFPSLIHTASSLETGSWVTRIGIKKGLSSEFDFFAPSLKLFPLKFIFRVFFAIGLIKSIAIFRRKKYFTFVLLIWLLFPILIPLTISQFTQPFFVDRYALISLAPFFVFVSMGAELLINFRKVFFLLLIPFLYFTILSSQLTPKNVSVENWRNVTAFVEENIADSKIPVLLYPEMPATKMGIEYYSKGKELNVISYESLYRRTNCYEKFYLISRVKMQNIVSKCKYKKTKTLFSDNIPYLYKYQLTGTL